MIKHIFKMIMNRKKKNFLMGFGIFFSFIVLFFVMSFAVFSADNFLKPMGFSYKNVWYITMQWNDSEDVIIERLRMIENSLKNIPEIKNFSYSRSLLLFPSAENNGNYTYKNKKLRIADYAGGDEFPNILNMKLSRGRWFSSEDDGQNYTPAVFTENAYNELFGDENVIGKVIEINQQNYKITGTVKNFRNGGEFSRQKKGLFRRINFKEEKFYNEFVSEAFFSRIILKMDKNATVAVEKKILDNLNSISKDWTFDVKRFEDSQKSANLQSLILPIILSVICIVLLFNISLGIFGITWYTTNKRRSEIGLRRALGSTSKEIFKLIIIETSALTTTAIFFGSLIIIQFPLLNLVPLFNGKIYFLGYIFSVIFIILLTAFCALYPAKLASTIEPSEALRYE